VFEYLAEVSTINPAIAVRAKNEMLRVVLGLFAHTLTDDGAASDGHAPDIKRPAKGRQDGICGFLNRSASSSNGTSAANRKTRDRHHSGG
jgi:hypothetical protein